MPAHIGRITTGTFDAVISNVKEDLKKEGWGLLPEIDIKNTLKNKLGVNFRHYTILGACNPGYAQHALPADEVTQKLESVVDRV